MLKLAKFLYILVGAADHGAHDRSLLFELILSDRVKVHDIRSIGDTKGTYMSVQIRKSGILTHAVGPMNLNGIIDDFQTHAWRIDFRHSDVRLGRLEAIVICL